ncbi:MAG: UDP-2,3-diacylglucosamine diphosphatase [Bacteroidota bacterium]|nr:UDP-2,3-diacylglucosamine diphosphatase [Bacteroidota bacterium]MDP4226123.1 UDP-2,3-diacylglucosamine diphosphatase [Bacteroidota bacterium]
MEEQKKIYFASDLHLGLYPYQQSREREKLFVSWLDQVKKDAAGIYLLGDMFDYWYEYKKVVPRGFTRFLGKICEITDSGIPVHYFTGNHDVWIFDYLSSETGVIVHHEPVVKVFDGKKFFIGHGDGLGSGDYSYKLLKAIFTSKFLQFCFSRIHPNLTVAFGQAWSRKSRYSKGISEVFKGEEREQLVKFAKEKLQKEHFDYFVFGHRHLLLDIKLNETSRYINVGDWIFNFSYAVWDGKTMQLKKYKK